MKNRTALWLFLALSTFYVAITRGHFIGTDEIGLYQQTRSLWERGNLSVGRIHNTFRGRDRLTYSQYSVGQSIAALPLYAVGKATRKLLEESEAHRLSAALAGRSLGKEPTRWGGDIEIFFVNLYNCFVTALLCALLFIFSTQLGAGPKWALTSALLVGLTSYVAPFATGFLPHASEALFVLLVIYLLFRGALEDESRYHLGAGVAAAMMILFRFQSVIALPALTLYLASTIRTRRRADALREAAQFLVPVVAGILLHLGVNYLKFETVWGRYNNEGFHTPLLKGLRGFLLSPGDSIFIFTPLLLLMPWTLRHFMRRFRAEAFVILGLAVTYLIFYGKYTAWHGLWSAMGPRYLVPIVPLLLLPLGPWLENATVRARVSVIPLAILGFWVQIVGIAVSFAFLYHSEGWPTLQPPFEFLFGAQTSPVLAGSSALIEGGRLVDMWLVNVYRRVGFGFMAAFAVPIFILLLIFARKLYATLRESGPARTQPNPQVP